MAQITRGIRAVLSHPFVYSSFQSLMGAHAVRQKFVAEFVRPSEGMSVLDVGCGPADILAYLPELTYYGFDVSASYIAQAQRKFGRRGKFQNKQLLLADLNTLPSFDVVLALGLLHHLDDAVATELMQLVFKALKPGGRLLTIDPCLHPEQSMIARFLVNHDRGQNVRNKAGYEKLANIVFNSSRVEIRHRAWIPYTHCFMECGK